MLTFFYHVNIKTYIIITVHILVNAAFHTVAPQAARDAQEPGPPDDCVFPPSWGERVYRDDAESADDPDITLGELLLLYFEWMTAHKVTDACARAVYNLLKCLLPEDSNAGSWALSQKLLKQVCESRTETIDICPNDCIAYIDCRHPKLAHYQHAHRTWCPSCGSDRRVTVGGKTRATKTAYFFPVGPYIRDLYRDKSLGPLLAWDTGHYPPGHVSKSRRFHTKVVLRRTRFQPEPCDVCSCRVHEYALPRAHLRTSSSPHTGCGKPSPELGAS